MNVPKRAALIVSGLFAAGAAVAVSAPSSAVASVPAGVKAVTAGHHDATPAKPKPTHKPTRRPHRR
jgi:hypothetical protein